MATSVRLYMHRGCPGSERARRYFEQCDVDYEELDILKDTEARAEFVGLGGIGTPLILVGKQVLHGFDAEEFERALRQRERGRARG